MLGNRKAQLLEYLTREYIETALPVGSGVLVDKYDLGVSSATIRNDLAELEKEGFIFQPHTSAGRVPTEKGFLYFVDNFLPRTTQGAGSPLRSEKRIDEEELDTLKESTDIKNFAKNLATILSETILIAPSRDDVYCTGIPNLFKKPEVKDQNAIVNISDAIDRLDEVISEIYDEINEEPKILIGEANPFGKECAVILMKHNNVLFGILGLIRMDYETNLLLIKYVKRQIERN